MLEDYDPADDSRRSYDVCVDELRERLERSKVEIGPNVTLYNEDCLFVLPTLHGIHACVTDPPYGLEFMGKDWDTFKPGYKQPQIGRADGSKFRQNRGTPAFTADGNPTCKNCGGDKYRNGSRKCSCGSPNFGNPRGDQMRAFQQWCEEWAALVSNALRPGGHLASFSGCRTYHRMACAIEDAGFIILT